MLKQLIQKLLKKYTKKSNNSLEYTEYSNDFADSNTDQLEEDAIENFTNGLTVEGIEPSSIMLGVPYPLYGIITDILEETSDTLVLEVNYNVKVSICLSGSDVKKEDIITKKALIKTKAFETGIFIVEFVSIFEATCNINKYLYNAICKTVIFGKSAHTDDMH